MSEEGIEDQVKGTIKGRIGLGKKLKKRLGKKEDKVVNLRSIPRVKAEELMKPVTLPQTGLEWNLVSSPFDSGPVFWTLKQLGDFTAPIIYAAIMALA